MALATQSLPVLNGHGVDDTDAQTDEPHNAVVRFATGLILPPPEIKSVIDRTAVFVAKSANPPQFEDKIRENQRNDPKFSFLNPADPYHAYYRHRMQKVVSGEVDEAAAPADGAAKEDDKPVERAPADVGKEPPMAEFILDLPTISGSDLDIMKLTALFTARRGRGFLAALSLKEGRNYQFDFLRPTHSLFSYFNRLVDQYAKVISPDQRTLDQLKQRTQAGARWQALADARAHAKWEHNKRQKDKLREDEKEAERIAFAEIDWHDYAIVQTIEFTAADSAAELPAPMSLQQVESMTLAQKRMAAMIHETAADDVEELRARQAIEDAEAAAAAAVAAAESDVAMETDEEGGVRRQQEEVEKAREAERAKAMQASAGAAGSMKIRTDYVPKLGAKGAKATTTCTICGQQVPVDELQEHMRIELLDPRWKSQRDTLEARKAQASELQRGANVVSSLKNLARTRVDIFGAEADEDRRRKEEEAEKERRREREKVVWDGHTASKVATQDRFSTTVNFEEQIAAIHRAKGLGPQDANALGPGIGPAAAPAPLAGLPPAPASLPAPPHQAAGGSAPPAYAAATVSSGPQPASMYPQPVMLPPLHYQGLGAAQPFGYQPPGPGMGPPTPGGMLMHGGGGAGGAGMPGGMPGGVQAGVVRNADQMEEDGDGPPTKRQKVAKLPGGQYYPEQDWISMHPHPVSLQVQLPDDASKPDWKLDGSTLTLPDLPLDTLVSTLRDRILKQTGSTVPASRMRLAYGGKMLTNTNTIASYNLEEEDVLVLSVRDAKKK